MDQASRRSARAVAQAGSHLLPAGLAGTHSLVTPATTAAAPIATASPTPAPPSTPEPLTMPRTCLRLTFLLGGNDGEFLTGQDPA